MIAQEASYNHFMSIHGGNNDVETWYHAWLLSLRNYRYPRTTFGNTDSRYNKPQHAMVMYSNEYIT